MSDQTPTAGLGKRSPQPDRAAEGPAGGKASALEATLPSGGQRSPSVVAPPDAPGGPEAPGGELDVGELSRGTTVGRYVVLHRLGGGAMGVVYAAYDPELDRQVALKLIRPSGKPADVEELRARLRREAQAMARLNHPNVVSVYDVGSFGEQTFVALQLVRGGTLREWLRAAPRPWRSVLEVFRQAARGLAVAHSAGVVHRDFKPDNLLVHSDPVAGLQVRVTDFGLAHMGAPVEQLEDLPDDLAQSDADAATLTRTGSTLGSPAYMSPEQMRAAPPDPRSDLFGFCVTFYEALYGSRPFAGKTVRDLDRAIREGAIAEPPAQSSVPAWLRRVVLRGLQPQADKRYPDMEALLQALSYDPRRRWVRAGMIAFGVVAVTVAAGAFPFALYLSNRACRGSQERLVGHWDAQRAEALQQAFLATGLPSAGAAWQAFSAGLESWTRGWAQMRTEACLATRVRAEQSSELLDLRMECLDDHLRSLDGLLEAYAHPDRVALGRASSAAEQLPPLADCANVRALRQIVRPPADPAARMRIEAIQQAVAKARGEAFAGRYAVGLPIALGAVASAEETGYRPVQAEALLVLGTIQFELDDHREAEETLHRAALAAETGGRLEIAADAYSRLIPLVGFADQRPDDAVRWAQHAAADIERMGGNDALDGQREQMLGAMLIRAGRPEEARQAFTAALPLYEKAYGDDHPRVAHVLEGLSVTLIRLGRDAEALPLLDRAQAIFNQVLGPDHPYAARGLINMGNAQRHLGHLDVAQERIAQALRVLVAAHAEETASGAGAHHDLGDVLLEQGQLDAARKEYLAGQAIDQKLWGDNHEQLAPSYEGLAAVELKAGRPAGAAPLLERALALLGGGPSNPEEGAEVRLQLARALAASDPVRARSLATAAGPVLERSVNPRVRAEASGVEGLLGQLAAATPTPTASRGARTR